MSKPITSKNDAEVREIHIPNGTGIIVGILGANRNPEIWGKDAYEWKPSRWLSPLPDTITQAHYPSVFSDMSVDNLIFCSISPVDITFRMTYLGGGRACM